MIEVSTSAMTGNVIAVASDGGLPPEYWAKRATDQIIEIGDTAHPALREQAHAFKERIESVVLLYMKQAIESDRSNL